MDWAILGAEPVWGVTALQAVDTMDAGPVWATETIAMPADPPRKSDLYNGLVADGAMGLIRKVLSKAPDPDFRPEPQDYDRPDVGAAPDPAPASSTAISGGPTTRTTSCAASVPQTDHPVPTRSSAGFQWPSMTRTEGPCGVERQPGRACSCGVDMVRSSCEPATAPCGSATSGLWTTRVTQA